MSAIASSAPNPNRAASGGGGDPSLFLDPSTLNDPVRYRRWRAQKLERARRYLAQPFVEIQDPAHLTQAELSALRERVEAMNFALYRTPAADEFPHRLLKRLCRQVGLARLATNPFSAASGISEIRADGGGNAGAGAAGRENYIPYTHRALNWHTDGYYNPPGKRINAFAMHTTRAAPTGGENQLLDHEILYLLLRDKDPALAGCLFANDVLSIPPGTAPGGTKRPAQTGPVFGFTADGRLQMRLTLRRRHAHWKPTDTVRAAHTELTTLLADPATPFILTQRLRAGEGIISNNIPHSRTPFTLPVDGQPGRLVLRARFYERVGVGDKGAPPM